MNEIDEPTPTQKVWSPVADLQAAHTKALMDLYNAVYQGDTEAALHANEQIKQIEVAQQQAHAAARAHVVKKAYSKVLKSQGASTAR